MNITSKASLKGRTFRALRVVKGATIEDIPAMRKSFEYQVASNPGAEMTETPTAFEFNNGQFVLKPIQPKETIGKLVCKATFAEFDGVRIEYTAMTLHANMASFETPNATYAIHAEN